jgi:hypothetical protein
VTISIALLWGGCAFRWSGDLSSAQECIDRLIWHAERHALTPYQAVGYGLKGRVLIQQGEIETGMELLRGSLATLSAERYELYATELNGSLAQNASSAACSSAVAPQAAGGQRCSTPCMVVLSIWPPPWS